MLKDSLLHGGWDFLWRKAAVVLEYALEILRENTRALKCIVKNARRTICESGLFVKIFHVRSTRSRSNSA
jgi:hypothetical protein